MERGKLYDGKEARPRDVLLDISTLDLRILTGTDGSLIKNWAWLDITVLSAPGGGLQGVLSHKIEAECRLVVPDDVWAASVVPHLVHPPRAFGAPMIALLCVASIAFLLGLFFYSPFALDIAARFVPYAWEEELGKMTTEDLTEGKACKGTPLAKKALEKLASRFDEEGHSFDIYVVDEPVINALSLPGRRIIIFQELINRAPNQEQLAGVLAHEVGHSYYRHPMRLFAQSAGGSLLLSLATGNIAMAGKAISAAHELLVLKGSREFELQADAYAVPALVRNHIDPTSLMRFLDYMSKQQPEGDDMPEWMNSHPITASRVAALKKQVEALKAKPKSLIDPFTPAEWRAIKSYCNHAPQAK